MGEKKNREYPVLKPPLNYNLFNESIYINIQVMW